MLAVATTRAPRCRAIWIAAHPTPPEPACTSTVCPGSSRTWRVSGIQTVRYVSRKEAPSANDASSGQREEPRLVHGDPLRVAAARQQGDDAAAVLRLPGHLCAEDRRQRRRLRVGALADQEIQKIHTRGTNVYQGLSPGQVRFGYVLKDELLGAAGLGEDDRLHGVTRRSAG